MKQLYLQAIDYLLKATNHGRKTIGQEQIIKEFFIKQLNWGRPKALYRGMEMLRKPSFLCNYKPLAKDDGIFLFPILVEIVDPFDPRKVEFEIHDSYKEQLQVIRDQFRVHRYIV